MRKTFKHLSEVERGKIEAFLRSGYSITQIAKELNRNKSTISREIHRGTYKNHYSASIALKRALKNSAHSHVHCKWKDIELLRFIEKHLKMKWSPEIISHEWSLVSNNKHFSAQSIYTLIYLHRTEWKKYLICKGKKYTRSNDSRKNSCTLKNCVSIEERPNEVNNRNRPGDFEIDTVVSCRGGKSCLAVIVCRSSRLYFIRKIKDKSASEMTKAIISVLKDFDVKTITFDNGKENAFHEKITDALKCKCYFCHPYASYEKGSIENRNKILRQFFKKGTNFDLISDEEISRIQDMINNRPMKVLNWVSPLTAFKMALLH